MPETLVVVRELIEQDRYVTYREIETSLNISIKRINKILNDHNQMLKKRLVLSGARKC